MPATNRPMPADPKDLALAMFRQGDKKTFGKIKMAPQRRKTRAKTPDLPATLDFPQRPLFIEHSLGGEIIPQRPRDGYINATLLCQQAGKLFADYKRTNQTQAFLQELSLDMGIPISNLVQFIRGRADKINQGTWVHPEVAIHLGIWLSAKFAVLVSRWVHDWMSGNVKGYMPEHVQRFMKNRVKIPHTHFSMLNEIYLNLFAPLEECGVIPPDKMMPDVSTGRMFSDFLRRKGIDPEKFPTYEHEFADSSRMPVQARLYPIEHLPAFRKYFNEVWLPNRAEGYFAKRFPKAVSHLPAILQLPQA